MAEDVKPDISTLHRQMNELAEEMAAVQRVVFSLQKQLLDLNDDYKIVHNILEDHESILRGNGLKELRSLMTDLGSTVTLLNRIVQGDSAIGHKGIDTRINAVEKQVEHLIAIKSKATWILIGIGLGNVVQLGYLINLAQQLAKLVSSP